MYNDVKKWIDSALSDDLPEDIKGIAFNIYEDGDNNWSFEIVGTSCFDPDDEDWACEEITDFETREEPFSWVGEADWQEIQNKVCGWVSQYLEDGENAEKLKSTEGVGVGFVDGDMEILFSKTE